MSRPSPAPSDCKGPTRRPTLRRWLRRGAWALAFAALLLVSLYVTRTRFLNPGALRFARWATRRFTPYRIEATCLRTDWYSRIEIEGLLIENCAEEGALRRLECERVALRIDLPALLRGRVRGIESVECGPTRAVVALDHSPPSESGTDAQEIALPEYLPYIEVESLALDLSLPDGRPLRAEGIALSTRSQETGPTFSVDWKGDQASASLLLDCRELPAVAWRAALALDEGPSDLQGSGCWKEGEVEGKITAQALDLETLERVLEIQGMQSLAGRVSLDLSFQLPVEDPRSGEALLDLGGRGLAFRGRRVESFEAHAKVAAGELHLGQLTAREGDDQLRVRDLRIPLDARPESLLQVVQGDLSLEVGDLEPWLEGERAVPRALPDHHLAVEAHAADGRVAFQTGELRAGGGSLELHSGELLLPRGAEPATLDLALSLDLPDLADLGALFGLEGWAGSLAGEISLTGPLKRLTGSLSLAGDLLRGDDSFEIRGGAFEAELSKGKLEVTTLRGTTPYGELDARLLVDLPSGDQEGSARIEALSLSAGEANLALNGPARLTFGQRLGLGPLELSGSAGSLLLELQLAGDSIEGQITARDLTPRPFLAALLPDAFPELTLSLDASLRQERLELSRLSLEGAGGFHSELTGSLPLAPLRPEPLVEGALSLSGNLGLDENHSLALGREMRLVGRLAAELELDGTWRGLTGHVRGHGEELVIEPSQRLQTWLPAPSGADFDLSLEPNRIRLETLELHLPERAQFSGRGELTTPLDLAALVRGEAGPLRRAPLSLRGELGLVDLTWLGSLDESIRRLEGDARGSLALTGSLEAPEVRANLDLDQGRLKLTGAPELTALELHATFEGQELQLHGTHWEMGAAPVSLQGIVDFSGADPRFDLRLSGENALLQRSATQRVRGDLDLALRGPPEALVISGDVALRHSRILQTIDFLSALRGGGSVSSQHKGLVLPSLGGPLAQARFEIDITTAEPLHVVSNLMAGDVRLAMHLGGNGEVLVPTGQVFLDNLRARLPGGTVTFPLGLITFREDSPYDPQLEIRGEARLAGYGVTLEVRGHLSDPWIDARSDPPLPADELMLLVLTGEIPPRGAGGEATARALGVYVARDLFTRWTGSGSLDEGDGFWSRLEITSGRDVSKAGVMTLEVTYRWRGDEGPDQRTVYLVAERDSFEDFNMGVRFVLRRR